MRSSIPGLIAAIAALALVAPALAGPRRPRVRYEDPKRPRPAATYARMGKAACLKELRARKIPFAKVGAARGVMAPVRLAGALSGVTFHTGAPEKERAVSAAEVMDCRLVLALDDWSRVLAKHGIDEVRTITAYRPPAASWPAGKPAVRHPGGLAVDVKALAKKATTTGASASNGARSSASSGSDSTAAARRWLRVESDFHGRIGAKVCDEKANAKLPADAAALRAVVCEAATLGIFTSILTPNYDRAHRDHLHVEVRPGAEWSLLL